MEQIRSNLSCEEKANAMQDAVNVGFSREVVATMLGVAKRTVDTLKPLVGVVAPEKIEDVAAWIKETRPSEGELKKRLKKDGLADRRGNPKAFGVISNGTVRVYRSEIGPRSSRRDREDVLACECGGSSWSTINIKSNAYSVPSQLIGEKVRVRLFDTRLEVYLGGKLQMTVERLAGKQQHAINYRHVIDSLLKRAGAFERYRYRDDLFPTITFRRAYDALVVVMPPRKADIEYLRFLNLAAKNWHGPPWGAP